MSIQYRTHVVPAAGSLATEYPLVQLRLVRLQRLDVLPGRVRAFS